MEIEKPTSELIEMVESKTQEKDINEDEKISLEKTIEVENSSLRTKEPAEPPSSSESIEVNSTQESYNENGKKKVKEEKPPSKIVVRRLPPTMTKDQFLEQVSPLPEVDYMYYVQGDVNNTINPFSRAYLNFVNQEDLFSFSRTFDNYVFLDAKGQEYPAIVEFAMFQRVPKQRTKKKDPLMGTIESDPSFITFKENLLAEALENSKPGGKSIKQHYFETEISTDGNSEEVNTTPLLEYLKVRRAEKARIREERREEKKRKELERKLKQKTKDKKGDGDEEELPKDNIKIQHKQSEKHQAEKLVDRNNHVSEKENLGNTDKSKDSENSSELKSESVLKNYLNTEKKISILKSENFEKNSGISSSDNNFQKKSTPIDSSVVKSVGNTKCDRFLSNNPKMGHLVQKVEELKVKEAEQQTQYLRKLLGLVSPKIESPSNKNEVSNEPSDKSKSNSSSSNDSSSERNVCVAKHLAKTEPPEEVLSALKEYISGTLKKDVLWSEHNISPALPSASFRTSNSPSSQGIVGEPSHEHRSLSAPRESCDNVESGGVLGRQVASSTPNVSIIQTEFTHNVFRVCRLLRKDEESSSAQASHSTGEEVLPSKDRRDVKERESRSTKKKEEKEKTKDNRVREYKSRGGKSYQEERLKLAERREELKKKELQSSSEKRLDTGEGNDMSETVDPDTEQIKTPEEKPVKIEKKRYENRKSGKYDSDDWKDDGKRRNRNDKNVSKRDGRDRKDEYSRRNSDRKNSDSDLRRKSKAYKTSEASKLDKKKASTTQEEQENKQPSVSIFKKKNEEETEAPEKKSRSFDDLTLISSNENIKPPDTPELDSDNSKKRCSSLENARHEKTVIENSLMAEVEKVMIEKKEKTLLKDSKNLENNSSLRSRKDISTKKSYLESKNLNKKKERSHEKTEEIKEDQHSNPSSQEPGAEGENVMKKPKEPSRSERRIRNKDRPSIEIYRPGMGKFSKQRLEKEKALGSSTEVESPSHSPSPTPKSKLIS